MANELQHRDSETGSTLYVTLRKPYGAAPQWSTVAADFEAITTANWGNYDVDSTSDTSGNYVYAFDMPAISGNMVAGWYWAEVYKQAGASAAISDEIRGRYFGYWDGTAFSFWVSNLVDVDGIAATKIFEMLAAFLAGKVSRSSAGGVTTLTYKKRDGSTTSFTVSCDEDDGDRATTGSLS